MTGIALPSTAASGPRILAPGQPGPTCATCKHLAGWPGQTDPNGALITVCIADPPRLRADGQGVEYVPVAPFLSCGRHAPKLIAVAR